MIEFIIDGNKGYPSSADRIKVTYENQYINDSGSYTYEINFPMNIVANRILFSNVNRFDRRKHLEDFEDCKMYVDGRLVISGKGTITGVTNDTVKMQIVGGKSRIKYNSKFEKHFLDGLEFPVVRVTEGLNKDVYGPLNISSLDMDGTVQWLAVDLSAYNYVGSPGVAAYNPIQDETNNYRLSNNIVMMNYSSVTFRGQSIPVSPTFPVMLYLAVQPNLMYVLKYVLTSEGYSVIRNDYDREPWNRLLIANVRRTNRISEALPHWTVYKFLEEIRKFFNASIVFDEINKTVEILSVNEIARSEHITYDCIDEYSEEYDEAGLESIMTSNIEYKLSDSSERSWREIVPSNVLKNYSNKVYDNVAQMDAAVSGMIRKDVLTTVFIIKDNYFVYEPIEGSNELKRHWCGYFNSLMRDENSNDSVELSISPAAMTLRQKWLDNYDGFDARLQSKDLFLNNIVYVPSSTNPRQNDSEGEETDENGETFVSVIGAIQGEEPEISKEESDEVLQIVFQGEHVRNINLKVTRNAGPLAGDDDTRYRWPITYTDPQVEPSYSFVGQVPDDAASLRLKNNPRFSSENSSLRIDAHNVYNINFLTKDIPDPSKIYVFRNKKFLCQKIEMEITEDGINDMKTGYFYEIL